MKKLIFLILPIFLTLSACNVQTTQNVNDTSTNDKLYIKSVWIAYYELQEFTQNNNENEFKKEIKTAFKNLQDMGFNTVTVQVRPCADAFYKSNYFPSSKYCFSEQGSEMPYDPLEIMCDVAKAVGLNIEAWINPYRVSQDADFDELCDDNIAKKWHNENSSNVYTDSKKIYFNPASDEVTKLIVNGVEEIVKNYDIYAIHFDDYFYPTKDKDIDKAEYTEYKENSGEKSLSDWRRDNVSNMIKSVYSAIKKINKNVLFGISPSANIDNDYSSLYADVEKWASEDDYCDYICPQIYYGFKNVAMPFMQTTKKWIAISNVDLYVGLPLYKAGKVDEYASDSDKSAINEFKNNSDIISRQITYLSKIDKVQGFYVFSYGSLSDENCKTEVENMLKVMK